MRLRSVFSKIVGTAKPTHDEEFLALARKGGPEALQRIEALITGQKISSIDITDSKKSTALHIATANNDIELSRLLIHHQCNVNKPDDAGRTPLMLAADYVLTMGRIQNAEIGGLLVAFGANVHVQDSRGRDALRHAVEAENIELIKLVAAHGGRADVPDAAGFTAADHARSRGLDNVLALLEPASASSDVRSATAARAPAAGKPGQ